MDKSTTKFIAREGAAVIIVYLVSFVVLIVRYHAFYVEPFMSFRKTSGADFETLVMDLVPVLAQHLKTALFWFIPVYIVYLVIRFFVWAIRTLRAK